MPMDPSRLQAFLDALGYFEQPMGMHFTEREPQEGHAPQAMPLPTAHQEAEGQADMGAAWQKWSCVLQHIWLARKKNSLAWFSPQRWGCLGGAFFLGYNKPQLEAIVHYVSSGLPGAFPGEHYFDSPQAARDYYREIDPAPAPRPYCVFQPLDRYPDGEEPLLVNFFARPEAISGLHQLCIFVTGDPEAVMSPWGAGCANLVTWPLRYLAQGRPKAVLGGWDPSCRKFLKTDEITFTLPYPLLSTMVARWPESFLATPTWELVRKKIARSRVTWGEDKKSEGGD